MSNATGTFEVTSGDEQAIHEPVDGPKLTHATGTQRFDGELQGQGSVDWLMCYLAEGTATFVGLQRIDGAVAGMAGTFVIEATGVHDGTASNGSWSIVAGSGTGELTGITGRGSFHAPGGRTVSYALDYQLD